MFEQETERDGDSKSSRSTVLLPESSREDLDRAAGCRQQPVARYWLVMAMISELKQLFGAWIDTVAGAIEAAAAHYARPRQILLTEGEGSSFTATMAPVKSRP